MSDPTDPPEHGNEHDLRKTQGNAQGDGNQSKSYRVGYGKPPVETRFVKGQSGNPLGRPRKRKLAPLKPSDASFDELLAQEAYRSVALRENGQPIELPAMQAAMRSLWAEAIRGKRLSQKYAFGMVQLAETERRKSESSKYDWLWSLKANGKRIIAAYKRSGRPVPEILPHPDDIIVNPLTDEARLDGPISREDADFCEYMAANRDFFLLYSEHLKRTGGGIVIQKEDQKPICAFLVFAHIMNFKLPTRYRWSRLKGSAGLTR